MKWHPKPWNHWFWRIKKVLDLTNKTWVSPLQKEFEKLDLSKMKKIRAYIKAPWIPLSRVNIAQFKIKGIQYAKSYFEPATFTDAFLRNDLVGIGVSWHSLGLHDISMTRASPQYLSVHLSELVAIDASLTYLHHLAQQSCLPSSIIIFIDSLSTLQAFQALGQQNAQSASFKILFIRSITLKTPAQQRISPVLMVSGSFPSCWQRKFSSPCPKKYRKRKRDSV